MLQQNNQCILTSVVVGCFILIYVTMYIAENTAIRVGMKRPQKQTDSKMVNSWNALLPNDGSGKIRKRKKKSKTVEQAKKDQEEKDRQHFIKDINNLKRPLAKKFY